MSKIMPFDPAHLYLGQLNIEPEYIQSLVERRPGFVTKSVFSGNTLVAVIGIKMVHFGVGEAYAFLHVEKHRYAKSIFWAAKRLVTYATMELKCHRIQASCPTSRADLVRWHEKLGFTLEGRLRGYDPLTQEDHFMFGRVG